MAKKKKSDFPEAEKWARVARSAQDIENFLAYCESRGAWLLDEDGHHPLVSRQDLIYGYFEIDAKKLEEDRREMLRRMRER
jgi:hypothetical protein